MNAPFEPVHPADSLVPISVPFVSRKRFAELIGVSADTVEAWVSRGYLPTFTIGRYSMINVAALTRLALDKEV